MGSVLETVQLLKEETARVAEYLKKLPAQAWATQSACDAWQVADVVAHVAGAIDRYGPNISRGAKGDYSVPADATPSGSPADRDAVMLANAQKVIDYRVSLGDGILDTFNESRLKFDAIFAELGEEDREKPCFHNAGIISIETYLNLRITELIIHEWDCRSKLEPGAVVSAESIPSIIENFPVFAVGRVFDPGLNMQNSARFRFELTGPGAESYDIVAGGGQNAIMELASDKRPDAIIGCDTQTFVLLVYGRVTLEDQIAVGNIFISRDRTGVIAQFGK